MQIETIPVWPTLFHMVTNGLAGEHKGEMMKLCYRLRDEGKRWGIAEESKYNLYESHPSLLMEPEATGLLGFFNAVLVGLVGPERRLEGVRYQCWCHIVNDGGFHDTHSHYDVIPGLGICGIYCLNVGQCSKSNGSIRFHGPGVFDQPDIMNVVLGEGQAILFPGHIKHSTKPYKGVDDRVMIAFNAYYVFSGS